MVLAKTIKDMINSAFHTRIGLVTHGFGATIPHGVFSHPQQLYRKPRYPKLDKGLLRLNEPMNQHRPVEVILHGTKYVQIFLLTYLDNGCQISKANLIGYTLINARIRSHHMVVRYG